MADNVNIRKIVAKFFDKNGFTLQLDGLRFLETVLKDQKEDEAQNKLQRFLNNIYSILQQTGKENTFMVNKELLEEALKLGVGLAMPATQIGGTKLSKEKSQGRGEQMDIEHSNTNGFKDKITEKIENSFIILSNFGELPYVCFRNQAREMTVIPNKERSILVSGKELIEKWIEKYHKMRFLIKNSGMYIYNHEMDKKGVSTNTKLIKLSEIGTLCGARGEYTIFGVVFRKGKKFYVQDTLSTIEINLDKVSFDNGFYHEKHFLILTGEMQANYFQVKHATQPYLDQCDPARLAAGKNHDIGGFKTKYLSLIKDMDNLNTDNASKKNLSGKKYLGIFEFDKKPTGLVYVFSDFNIQDPQNLQLFEHMVISLGLETTAANKKPDVILLCGPFMNDILINSKEDQSLLEETYLNFGNLLLKHQKTLKNIIIGMVPDLNDPVMNLIPRKPLPEYLLQKVSDQLPKFCLLENPVHFSYCGRSTVVFRADLLKILARKELTKVTVRNNVESFVNTVLGQRNLAPVSNYCLPRLTGYEDSLELFSLPDQLILCDNLCESGHVDTRGKCDVFTAGSVSRQRGFLELDFINRDGRLISKDQLV